VGHHFHCALPEQRSGVLSKSTPLTTSRVERRCYAPTMQRSPRSFGSTAAPQFKFTEAISFVVNCETQAYEGSSGR
jgi:hypothetical protein